MTDPRPCTCTRTIQCDDECLRLVSEAVGGIDTLTPARELTRLLVDLQADKLARRLLLLQFTKIVARLD